jgi:hypothetical protein
MVQRVVLITVVQIVLYATLIPMRIAYEVSCQRAGATCGSASAPSALRSQRSLAYSFDQPLR